MAVEQIRRSSVLLTDTELVPASDEEHWQNSAAGQELDAPRGTTEIEFTDGKVSVGQPPAWFEPVVHRLRALASLPPNWDSYGARPIRSECAQEAIRLLLYALQPDDPMPAIVPVPQGGLQLEWHEAGVDVEVEIESPRCVHIAVEDKATGDVWERTVSDGATILAGIVARLRRKDAG